MQNRALDLLAIGDAIVDVLAPTTDAFLVEHGLHKGMMRSVDAGEADALYALVGTATVMSGGSAANTAVGAAALGVRTAYVGKVRDDEPGHLFVRDLRATGVRYDVPPAVAGKATARCIVMVTPDGERTMNTYLGICQDLSPDDVDEDLVASAGIVLIEGYLWGAPGAQAACEKAVRIAKDSGGLVAFTLSDPLCAERNRETFRWMIGQGDIDILFANKHEIRSLYETSSEAAAVSALLSEADLTGVVTLSGEGCLVARRSGTSIVPAHPIEELVDTTGAGDSFAAGYLAGVVKGWAPEECARLGGVMAAHVIQHIGARARIAPPELARQVGFAL